MEQSDAVRAAEWLKAIPVADLDRDDWLRVGMALHDAGLPVSMWDAWSQDDERYRPGECSRLWAGFRGSSKPVTLGTVCNLAKQYGYTPASDPPQMRAIDWGDPITLDSESDAYTVDEWHPAAQLIEYLRALYRPEEYVGYCTKVVDHEGRKSPTKGCYDRTAGELIAELEKCGDDLGAVLGDYDETVGAWIRFNPVDGQGVRDENVTRFRYALVESDDASLGDQEAAIRRMQLPVALLVYSGGKSLHALVKVDAENIDEYRQRVDFLYGFLEQNGISIDRQNRNPSRLSRMPGITRNGKHQQIIARDLGRASWAEWLDWAEGERDELPQMVTLADVIDDLPPLAPELITGILRQGHKLLLSAPSKAGKTFALMELSLAIAEGREWLGFPVAAGKVLYINFEIDAASFFHRYANLYARLGWNRSHPERVVVWNMRGHAAKLEDLTPKLVRRVKDEDFRAIIIDPIYKLTSGDENSAADMSRFVNELDKVAEQTGASVIICHHHAKGAAGNKKSEDRMSGSGVFARDPDAILDLSPIMLDERTKAQYCDDGATAWRLTCTLREFKQPAPVNVWFRDGWHDTDRRGVLDRFPLEGEATLLAANTARGIRSAEDWADDIAEAVDRLQSPTLKELAEDLGVRPDTVRRKLADAGYKLNSTSGRIVPA